MEFNKWNSSKNGHYSNFFFLGNIDQENVFYDILERKNAFLGYKNKKFKKTKNYIFPKGLTHGIGPKMAIISTFFFRQQRPGKCLLRYSRPRKKPFQAIKTRISNRRKLDIFKKGLTYGFAPKMTIYPTFFFLAKIGQENVFYDILERKNAFQSQKQEVQKVKKLMFFQRG